MNLFTLIKQLLLKIQQKNILPDLKPIKEREGFLVLRYISEKGLEQDILAKTLKSQLDGREMPENFYAYLLWIAGELMNNVFDHGQTLGRALKGGILALNVKDNIAELAIGDLGIGIKASLEKNPQIQIKKIDAKQAIQLALTENTSGWPHKRGNGLPDVFAVIKLSQFGRQLSGRDKGQEAYEVLVRRLTELPRDGVLLIDLSDIVMMNSSFGDQALGVLLENIKHGHFGWKKVFFTGKISEAVDLCLDRIAEIRDVEMIKV